MRVVWPAGTKVVNARDIGRKVIVNCLLGHKMRHLDGKSEHLKSARACDLRDVRHLGPVL